MGDAEEITAISLGRVVCEEEDSGEGRRTVQGVIDLEASPKMWVVLALGDKQKTR